jgi:hypothetical protein
MADSFAVALAKTRGATLITSDHHEFDVLQTRGEDRILWIRSRVVITHDRQDATESQVSNRQEKNSIWYYEHLEPMSGARYRRLPQGPVADIYFRALDELEEEGAVERKSKGRAIMISLIEKEAPENRLDPAEVLAIKRVAEAWKGRPTKEIVDFTHQQLPWLICRDGEVIPYGLITQEEQGRVYGRVEL